GVDPDNKEVCHECNNPPCCNPLHLFLGNHSDNMQHAFDCGRNTNRGVFNANAKLSKQMIDEIKLALDNGEGPTNLAKLFGVTPQHISAIKHGRVHATG
ncbi:MAG: HNH endonuclease, partial [Nitrososphaera sp.]|nr:HNH endonuclease [Nitrososphaera sp.]